MSKPSPLLAQLKQTTAQAQHGGNVVSLPIPAAAPLAEPAGQPPADPAGDPDYSAMLAELDAMVQQQNAAQARTDAEEDGQSGPGLASVAPGPVPGFGANLAAQVATLTAAGAAAKASGPVTASQGIDHVNLTHFVAPLSGEATIWREGADAETGAYSVVPVSQSSFRLEFAPIKVGVDTANGIRTMSIADIWLGDKRRREYPGGVVFEPEGPARIGCFNTWRGYGVTPKAGDPSPMIDHVYMLCGGSALLAEYMLNWLAFVVQRPGTRPEVAMVLRGGQGTGKGTVFRIMLAIFGPHGLHITQPRHLTGNFNSHLRSTRYLFIDEGFWAGDKAGEGVLKGLITEPTISIEMKGRDVFTAQNRLALCMAANGVWVVPAGADERRYFVVDLSADRAQDHAYFGALNAWIDGDGAAIFLDHLLQRDLSGFNVRAAPKTAALDRQKIEAMPALDRWIMEALDTETCMAGEDWTEAPHRVACDSASARFDTYCKRAAVRGTRADSRAIGKRLGDIFGCGPSTIGRAGASTRRGWNLPGITEARKLAATAFGLAHYVWGQS